MSAKRCWDDEPGCNCANRSPGVPVQGAGTDDELREAFVQALLAWWGEDAGESVQFLPAAQESAHEYSIALLSDPGVLAAMRRREQQAAAKALEPFQQLFAGGPDTTCRTTWRGIVLWDDGATDDTNRQECAEVPMDDLRDAFDRAASIDPTGRPDQ